MSVAEVLLRLRTQGVENVEDVARALRDVEEQAQRTEAAQDALNESAGRVGSGAAKMAGALSLVAPAGGEAARTLADLADVVEVATEAAAGLNVGWSALAAGAAAVGLALSPLVLLWQDYSAVQEQATAAAEAWNRAQDSSLPLVDRAYQSVRALNLEVSGLTDAEKEQAKIALDWDAALAQANATVREELDLARERLAQLGPSKAGYVEAAQAVATLEAQLRDNADTAAKGMRADQLLAEVRRETAEANKTLEERERALVSARKDSLKTAEEQVDVEAELAANVSALLGTWRPTMGLIGDSATLAEQEVDAALGRMADNLQTVGQQADEARVALQRMEQTASSIDQITALGASAGSAITSGSASGLVAAIAPTIGGAVAGPVGVAVGSAVGAALSFLEDLGAAGGASAIGEKLLSSVDDIVSGLQALPDLFAEAAPDLAVAFALQIEPVIWRVQLALIKEILLLPYHIWQRIGDWWESMGGLRGIGLAVWDALKGWWGETWDSIKAFIQHPFGNDRDRDGKTGLREAGDTVRDALSYIWTGSYAVGSDYIPRTGLALVHQGERITPANMRAAKEGSSGGEVHIHLQGFSIGTPDQLVRELNRVLGDSGRRLAWRG